MRLRHILASVLAALATAGAGAARAAPPPASWPPASGEGDLFVHYGEEHWNDIDGEAVLTRVVADAIRFRPALVTMSGDKAEDGTTEQLTRWLEIMQAYDRAGIPWMAAVGNHDGKQPTPESATEVSAGSTPIRDITFYKQVFAGRPYPMGDAAPYAAPGMAPRARAPGDPEGAATHFWVDTGEVRWVFLDSSCFGIQNCDGSFQNPPDDEGRTQYEFLRAAAAEANVAGKLIFVVTHMPTRDPRDQEHSTTLQRNHVMGKGISPDNQALEAEAQALGVDGVLVAHIKGQWQYRGAGDVPYYIDGGAGGELYTMGPRGVDHGYWYGFRLLRVHDKRVVTDVVPVVVPGGLSLTGRQMLPAGGDAVTYEAFARQPATKSPRGVVERLELRDPAPTPRTASLPPALLWLAPFGLLAVLVAPRPRLRRLPRAIVPALGLGMLALAGVAAAQQAEPTSTPRESLPNPARIFTSGDPRVLAPAASETDDPRRDRATQTADGGFRPACPGRTFVAVTAGWETARLPVRVLKKPGRVVRSVRRRGREVIVRLAQSAIVEAKLARRGRKPRVLRSACLPAGRHRISAGRGRLTVRVAGGRPRRFVVR